MGRFYLQLGKQRQSCMHISWSEVTSVWSEVTLVWGEVTSIMERSDFGWGEMNGGELTMWLNDRIPSLRAIMNIY